MRWRQDPLGELADRDLVLVLGLVGSLAERHRRRLYQGKHVLADVARSQGPAGNLGEGGDSAAELPLDGEGDSHQRAVPDEFSPRLHDDLPVAPVGSVSASDALSQKLRSVADGRSQRNARLCFFSRTRHVGWEEGDRRCQSDVVSLRSALIRRISNGGPIPFEDFMAAALYDPAGGFFTSRSLRSVKEGDFLTSRR